MRIFLQNCNSALLYLFSEKKDSFYPKKYHRKSEAFLVIFFAGILSLSTYSQTRTVVYANPGQYSWTVPCGVTSITVEAWGAGGAGGGVQNNGRAAGGGGAGGSYTRGTFAVTAGGAYTLFIGTGGTGNTGNGGNGEDTWFNSSSVLRALGGSGGIAGLGNAVQTGAGAIAANAGNINTGTAIANFYGGDGATAVNNQTSGGGGGGAGTTEDGYNAVSLTGGLGGLNDGGDGADGRDNSGAGFSGLTPGGAGSGARKNPPNGSAIGGNGGDGAIRITFTLAANYYCPFNAVDEVEPITNVTFASINQNSASTIGIASNTIPSHQIFCNTPADIQAGATIPISISGNTGGNYTNYITAFFDWNQNGDFSDAGETYNIGSITNGNPATVTGNILVPVSATLGNTTMRVVKVYNNTFVPAPCVDAFYGEAEDYRVNVIAPPACSTTPIGGTATISATSGPISAIVTLTASGYTPSNIPGISFQWQYSDNGGAWNNIAGATNPATLNTPVSGTTGTTRCFRLRVRCSNPGGGDNFSNTVCYLSNSSNVITLPNTGNISFSCGANITLLDPGGNSTYGGNRNGYIILNNSSNTTSVINISGWIRTCEANDYVAIYDGAGLGGVWLADVYGINNSFSFTSNPGQTLTLQFNSDNNNNGCDGLQLAINYSGSCNTSYPCSPTPYQYSTYSPGPPTNYYYFGGTIPGGQVLNFSYFTNIAFSGTLNDVAQASTYNPNNSSYQDFSGNINKASQEQGAAVNIIFTATRSKFVEAWVDWNKDNTFQASEIVYNTYTLGTSTATGTFGFQIPLSTVPGDYRLRLRTFYTAAVSENACVLDNSLFGGETEDYLFTVIKRCNARITNYLDDTKCNPGTSVTFNLNVTGTDETSSFKWYDNQIGGSLISTTTASGNPRTSTFSPALNTSMTYWVAAVGTATDGSACETPTRVKVSAIMNPLTSINFTPGSPYTICGTGSTIAVNPASGIETKYLVDENFEAGGLGVFSVINNTPSYTVPGGYSNTPVTNRQWQNQTSIYTPTNTTAWRPAISSGFGSNRFAYATSDETSASILTILQLTTGVNTVGFTSLNFSFDMYYSHYYTDANVSNGGSGFDTVSVQVSPNGTNWFTLEKIVSDQGKASSFLNKSYTLTSFSPTLLGMTGLKIRFLYRAEWADGIAIDNVKLWGQTPASSQYLWTPVNGNTGGNMYTSFTSPVINTPYDGVSSVSNIIVVPTAAQIAAANASAGTYALDFEASVELSNGCFAKGIMTVIIGESVWNGGAAAGGVAGGGDDWNVGSNWCSGTVPTSSSKIRIPTSPTSGKYPVIYNGNVGVTRFLTILNGASVSVNNGGTLQIMRDLNTQTGGTFSNNGTVILAGTEAGIAQNFPGPGTIAAMKTLEINNSGNGVLINNSFAIDSLLKPTLGSLDLDEYDITIRSTAAGTAAISPVTNGFGFNYSDIGRFVIERYINYVGNWNLLASPIYNNQKVWDAWQNGGAIILNTGTRITAPTGPDIASGIDNYSPGYSLKWWNESGTGSWANIADTRTASGANVNNNRGYYLFVRGDRNTLPPSTGLATTLKSRGQIYIGNSGSGYEPAPVSYGTLASGITASVANPFASAIDFANVYANTNTDNVKQMFYLWDPYPAGIYGLGRYQNFYYSGGTWLTTPAITDVNSPYYNQPDYSKIQSGQAFFIESNGAGAVQVEFNENDKISGSRLVTREPVNEEELIMLSTMLHAINGTVIDGNRVLYKSSFTNGFSNEDASKINNTGINFGILSNAKQLIIEGRQPVQESDTIHYSLSGLLNGNYKLSFEPLRLQNTGLIAELIDRFLNIRSAISLSDSSWYNFEATSNPASKASNRFMLVFRAPGGPLPVTFISVAAQRLPDRSIKVNWEVANETNIEKFEVERSEDGRNFSGILNADATNSNQYTKNDLSPLAADNFYRIKAIGIAGDITYSNIVKVTPVKSPAFIVVSPNPVKGKQMNVRFMEQPAGEYNLSLTNKAGQEVYRGFVTVNSNNQVKSINLHPNLAAGTYHIVITDKKGELIATEQLLLE